MNVVEAETHTRTPVSDEQKIQTPLEIASSKIFDAHYRLLQAETDLTAFVMTGDQHPSSKLGWYLLQDLKTTIKHVQRRKEQVAKLVKHEQLHKPVKSLEDPIVEDPTSEDPTEDQDA